jgi:hypothetical protein
MRKLEERERRAREPERPAAPVEKQPSLGRRLARFFGS